MKYKADQELALATELLTMADDPLAYAEFNYPWGKEGTPLAQAELRRWQRQALIDVRDHTQEQLFRLENGLPLEVYREVTRSGRGPGKSALLAILSEWQLSSNIGSSVVVTANTESQMRNKTFPEFHKWFTLSLNAHWWHLDSMRIYPRDWLADLVREQLHIDPGYWGVTGQNWSEENPDAFAGTHNAYGLTLIMDEASGIDEAIWKVANGFFTEQSPYRYWLAFSNPRRNAGAFHNRCFDRAFAGTWKRRHLNCLHIEGIDQSANKAIIAEYGENSDTARVEVYGEPPEASTDQFIANSVVRGAQSRNIESFDDSEPLIMGVDPAPRGRTVIRFRQGRDARSIKPTVLQGKDNEAIADEIVRLSEKYDPDAIAIDAGQGTGVIDGLKRRGVKTFEVWMGSQPRDQGGEFATLGTELWGLLRDWLPGGCIDDGNDLFRDLTARTWRWHGREDGKKILTSKKEMAKDGIPSPDDGDALAVTFYPRVPRRNRGPRLAGRLGSQRMAKDVDYPVLG